jgi:hypothetical protein
MDSEATTSETTTPLEGAFLRKLLPETIPSATGNGQKPRSPVDVVIALREDLARFQRVGGNKQALRETLRKELREACRDALHRAGAAVVAGAGDDTSSAADADTVAGAGRPDADRPGYLNIEPIVEYLTERRHQAQAFARASSPA